MYSHCIIIGHDMGMGEKYDTEVNCSTAPMPDEEYVELMQSLNLTSLLKVEQELKNKSCQSHL